MSLLLLYSDTAGYFNMEIFLENILIYSFVILLCVLVVYFYLRRQKRKSELVESKIIKAKQEGLYEPVSLHPVVDVKSCIQSEACIAACPEKDILGIRNGKATTINASLCIGHGACFLACPTQAISLCIGTEKRGIDLPHVDENFESNVPGIFIAGELGGMGLIKNAIEQGKQAVQKISAKSIKGHQAQYDLAIIGAGPAGISASLMAKKNNLNAVTFEQDTLGGAVFTYPRSKIVMTSAVDLPLYGKVKFSETGKSELLDLWKRVLGENNVIIRENSKVDSVTRMNGHFQVTVQGGENITAKYILLAIGRRGTPRKLNVPGEMNQKVAYRLLEPENIVHKDILVVGGGDSAIEAALLLAENNKVTLSYRGNAFSRIKSLNNEKIQEAIQSGRVTVRFGSQVNEINESDVLISQTDSPDQKSIIKNDLVFIFAGGELPSEFLLKAGILISKKFGEAILKHK